MKIISFDFDDTLALSYEKDIEYDNPTTVYYPNPKALNAIIKHITRGNKVIIVSTRLNEHVSEISQFLKDFNIPIDPKNVYNTNGVSKIQMLENLNVNTHYDDNDDELESLKTTDINGININEI